MEESFRRAIRRMTGRSLLFRPEPKNRGRLEASLAQSMAPNWSIALFEHLEAATHLAVEAGTSEMISFGASAWKLAETAFPKIEEEVREKFNEFREKWKQRWTTEELHRILLSGNWLLETPSGWVLALKGSKTDVSNLYLATTHLMVGDAEKLFVMLNARLQHLQERLGRLWLEESVLDASSKVLPSLEESLRKKEDEIVSQWRATISQVARVYFSSAFPLRAKPRAYSTSLSCVRAIGRAWNSSLAYENAFLAFLDDFCDYVFGLSLLMTHWYRDKWKLFLRGFSRGQLDLFGSFQSTGTIS